MKYIDIIAAFEREIGAVNDLQLKPYTDDSLFWLNQAVAKFVKLRFNGDFAHRQGVEQTEKRRIDLSSLFVTVDLECRIYNYDESYTEHYVTYPDNFLYALNEDVVICDKNNEHKMNTCVFECTKDSFMYRVNNSLTDFHYRSHRARPLRIRTDEGCSLLTDGNYKILKYTLGYIRKPNEITLEAPTDEYTDFQDHIMYEIIKIAAQMYIENTANQRYQTISQEVLTQE